MKKLILFLLILLLNFNQVKACLNYYYTVDSHGHLHPTDPIDRIFNTNFNLQLIESKLLKLEKQLKQKSDYKLLSDYTVLLMKAGKIKESLTILETLSKYYPNEYQIAANLGTAYELNGELEKAIRYIKRGMKLNPNAHDGSEWVHIKVLETKQKLVHDPTYLVTHSVLQLNDKNKNDSAIRAQILIQVKERFPFSPGPNEIMASILMDLGDCYANTHSIEFAKAIYTVAKKYYGSKDKRIDDKINQMLKLRNKYVNVDVVERTNVEGDNQKVTGIQYFTLLTDNNPTEYQINWSQILTNSDKLLTLAALKETFSSEESKLNEKSLIAKKPKSSNDEKENGKESLFTLKYFLFGFISVLIVGLIYRKRNNSK